MEYIKAKTIVTRNKNKSWFGTDYNMNIYKGCSHGCIYCDSRSSCYQINNFDRIKIKENALEIIRNDLRRKVKKGIVGTGAMSDPYNPYEKDLLLTRHSLELINAFGFGLSIVTKSPLITRDIDVIRDIAKHSPVIIKMTITTANDELCKKIEPNVAESSKRFRSLKKLIDNNIFSGIILMPILPFINDTKENILNIIKLAKNNGAKFIYPSFGVTLRQNQREYFYNKLDQFFPNIKLKYIQQYGDRYKCGSKKAKKLYHIFANECEKQGLLYSMDSIIRGYKLKYQNDQINFFDLI
ncbi:MAG: radical SAM protein [Eubacteriales bacterium]